MTIIIDETASFLDLGIMMCSDQYDTGNETCCVVGIMGMIESRVMEIAT